MVTYVLVFPRKLGDWEDLNFWAAFCSWQFLERAKRTMTFRRSFLLRHGGDHQVRSCVSKSKAHIHLTKQSSHVANEATTEVWKQSVLEGTPVMLSSGFNFTLFFLIKDWTQFHLLPTSCIQVLHQEKGTFMRIIMGHHSHSTGCLAPGFSATALGMDVRPHVGMLFCPSMQIKLGALPISTHLLFHWQLGSSLATMTYVCHAWGPLTAFKS